MKTETTEAKTKAKKVTGKRMKGINTFATLDGIVNALNVPIIQQWAKDPNHRAYMRQLVRAGLDFQRMRMAADARMLSPTSTNEAQLLPEDLQVILLMGDRAREFEEQIKKGMAFLLKQSEIGRWLLDQKGLGAGWLAGYILAEFPDIYDVRRCSVCGQHGFRDVDGVFHHPKPPERKAIAGALPDDEDEDDQDALALLAPEQRPSKIKCVHDGAIMDDSNSYVHERKPSTFIKFAGLATEPSWACPHCHYGLFWSDKREIKGWVHPNHRRKDGPKHCPANGRTFLGTRGEQPISPVGDMLAEETRRSPKRVPGQKSAYKSQLRSKLIGPKGVADQFVLHKHPKYRPLYDGYVNYLKARDPWRATDIGWLRQMGLRKVASQFVIDFFVKWRTSEGLPCRKPYAEEKLGIIHHP